MLVEWKLTWCTDRVCQRGIEAVGGSDGLLHSSMYFRLVAMLFGCVVSRASSCCVDGDSQRAWVYLKLNVCFTFVSVR